MKRKVKPKVFLMSMAVAASLPAGVFAQEGGHSEHQGFRSHYSNGGRGAPVSDPIDVIQEAPEMRINDEGGGLSSKLFNKLQGMAENLSSRVEAVPASEQDKAWKLELSQAEPARLGSTDNPKVTASKPVGMALRLKF